MNGNDDRLDILLDETLEHLRRTEADEAAVAGAAGRVRARLLDELAQADAARVEAEQIRSCDDWQRLIPAHLDGDLSDARRLLLEDHTRECLSCRRALRQARPAPGTAATSRGNGRKTGAASGWHRDWTWSVAAAALIVFALIGFGVKLGGFGIATGGLVRVETVEGSLMQVADLVTTPAVAGEQYDAGEAFRTARESGAVMTLEDGSRVEMNERSEVSISRDGRSNTIHLQRGDIIVQAAEQGSGRLYVQTPDTRIAVAGTIFSVSAGTKGSRIAVLQGEVVVEHSGERVVLHPGEQYASNGAILPVSVDREIAWSRDADHWRAVAHEMELFQAELDRRIGDISQRYASRLLDVAPAGTVVYAAIPNLSEVVGEAHALLLEKVAANETFRTWWDENVAASGADAEIEHAMGVIERLGRALGDEIALTLQASGDGEVRGPIVMAETKDADAVRREVDAILAHAVETGGGADVPRRIDDPATCAGETPAIWVGEGHLVFAADGDAMRRAAAAIAGADGATLLGSEFRTRLDAAYSEGVGVLVGADLRTMLAHGAGGSSPDPSLQALGFGNVRYLLIERSDLGDVNRTRATLTVDGEREGVLSWLAEPAPMGGLEFVSPDALAVTSFVMRRPATLVEDLLQRLGSDGDAVREHLDTFRTETGVDLLADVAGALGGELTLALDGPILPKPAWKAVVEVYDPAALQRTLDWGVERWNAMAASEGRPGLRLTSEDRRGRTTWTLASESTGLAAHYTFVDGYWLIASQPAMIDRALQYRASGITLGTSKRFRQALPEDGNQNVSALMYQDLGRILGSVLEGPIGESLPENRKELLRSVVASQDGPATFVAYGRKDAIQVVGTDRGSFLFGDRIARMFNIGTLFDLENALPDTDPDDPDAPARYDGGGADDDPRAGA